MKQDWKINICCSGIGNDNSKMGIEPCGKMLNVGTKDVFVTYRKFWDGEKLEYYSIKCPHCGSITDLDERTIPVEVKSCALARANDKRSKGQDISR